MQIGTVTAGISVARQLPRNRKMTSTTSTAASANVTQIFSMARLMNCESSEPTDMVMPSDRFGAISPATCLARSEEHTSEIQSLMRISYTDFVLQKNTDSKKLIGIAHFYAHDANHS